MTSTDPATSAQNGASHPDRPEGAAEGADRTAAENADAARDRTGDGGSARRVALVIGDVAYDWYEWDAGSPDDAERCHADTQSPDSAGCPDTDAGSLDGAKRPRAARNADLSKRFHRAYMAGGAVLVAKLLKDAGERLEDSLVVRHVDEPGPHSDQGARWLHTAAQLTEAENISEDKERRDNEESCYRVSTLHGFFNEHRMAARGPACGDRGLNEQALLDGADPDLVVIDDSGNGFRNKESWDQGAWNTVTKAIVRSKLLVVKLSRPLAIWYLADKSVEPRNALLAEVLKKRSDEKNRSDRPTVIIVNADDLRSEDFDISRRLSWERTLIDLGRIRTQACAMRGTLGRSALTDMLDHAHLIVRFGHEGAVFIPRTRKKREPAVSVPRTGEEHAPAIVVFDPGAAEGSYERQGRGTMIGARSAFTAAVVASLAKAGPNCFDKDEIEKSLAAGLLSARRLYNVGFEVNENEFPPIKHGEPLFPSTDETKKALDAETQKFWPKTFADPSPDWTMLDSLARDEEKLLRVVTSGFSKLAGYPTAKFGKLFLADRSEIEGYRSIENLFREYIEGTTRMVPDKQKPISVAVFGRPGSGKSFGVKQIATEIAAGRLQEEAVDLSQFETANDLVGAFHRARDAGLSGKIPMLIFDEFDSRFQGLPLGWLKYFLAPMQEGTFKDSTRFHPIGVAIFVFTGGTAHSFADFFAKTVDQTEFRAAKGPDFASRLRGFVDVRGPNPAPEEKGSVTPVHRVRRAVLLRSFLQSRFPRFRDIFYYKDEDKLDADRINIDPRVVRAFLNCERYVHGARSMEAILDMSVLTNRDRFEIAALPSDRQIRLHVDKTFLELLRS